MLWEGAYQQLPVGLNGVKQLILIVTLTPHFFSKFAFLTSYLRLTVNISSWVFLKPWTSTLLYRFHSSHTLPIGCLSTGEQQHTLQPPSHPPWSSNSPTYTWRSFPPTPTCRCPPCTCAHPWFEAMKISDVSAMFRGPIRSFEDRADMSVPTAAQINRITLTY